MNMVVMTYPRQLSPVLAGSGDVPISAGMLIDLVGCPVHTIKNLARPIFRRLPHAPGARHMTLHHGHRFDSAQSSIGHIEKGHQLSRR